MKIGVLTGGGDAPGLNAAIRSIVKYSSRRYRDQIIGIRYGWKGFVDEEMPLRERTNRLTPKGVSGILTKGGTILHSSRTNPLRRESGLTDLKRNFEELELDGLIAIGGEDTLSVAYEGFAKEGLRVVGIPKTIDNDLNGTDSTIGYTTACEIVTEAVDRLHSTAESHDRIMIVEVMGRHTGWIALRGGVAGGADVILIPEFPMTLEEICALLQRRQKEGKLFSIIVIAEGYPLDDELVVFAQDKDAFGHERLGGVGDRLAALLKTRMNSDIRVTNLGHTQRGGIPSTFDRWIATFFGVTAVDLLHRGQFGRMAAISNNEFIDVELREAVSEVRRVPEELYNSVRALLG